MYVNSGMWQSLGLKPRMRGIHNEEQCYARIEYRIARRWVPSWANLVRFEHHIEIRNIDDDGVSPLCVWTTMGAFGTKREARIALAKLHMLMHS